MIEFQGFPKIARLHKPITITEKLDGTNAQIYISDDGNTIMAGSRNRWLTVNDDNFGFANWVEANKDELLKLGPGRHFGEWWGKGIQRGYDLSERRFSLFNTHKWGNPELRPACCHVVHTLYHGDFSDTSINTAMYYLTKQGSFSAPGFMQPEGIIVYHSGSNTLFKKTFDDNHKGT
jgi:hypothetical protein